MGRAHLLNTAFFAGCPDHLDSENVVQTWNNLQHWTRWNRFNQLCVIGWGKIRNHIISINHAGEVFMCSNCDFLSCTYIRCSLVTDNSKIYPISLLFIITQFFCKGYKTLLTLLPSLLNHLTRNHINHLFVVRSGRTGCTLDKSPVYYEAHTETTRLFTFTCTPMGNWGNPRRHGQNMWTMCKEGSQSTGSFEPRACTLWSNRADNCITCHPH